MSVSAKVRLEQKRVNSNKWRRENPEKDQILQRRCMLRRRHGITLEAYEAMEAAQKGVCAICHMPPPGRSRLHIDHCHKSGEIRALLCIRCNTALGQFDDNPDRMRQAALYVEKHNEGS